MGTTMWSSRCRTSSRGSRSRTRTIVYHLLFRASAATLLQVVADTTHLGAAIGFLTVLHTWGQNLLHHPHVHCVIPVGGLSPDRTQWVHPRYPFFLPFKVLSRVFRGKFVAGLKDAFRRGQLAWSGDLQPLADAHAFRAFLRPLFRHDWVVYAKPPFGGPEHVLHYLARYTHRVAISNHRIEQRGRRPRHLPVEGLPCTAARSGRITVSADEFLRRFLLHVLPKSFVRIRFFGFLASRRRGHDSPRCPQALASSSRQTLVASSVEKIAPPTSWPCPRCGGVMIVIEHLTALQIHARAFAERIGVDTS